MIPGPVPDMVFEYMTIGFKILIVSFSLGIHLGLVHCDKNGCVFEPWSKT